MFSTLQRPTLEELERRRALRETFSPPRTTTLHRRESMLSKGFNALFRRDSMLHKSNKSREASALEASLNLRTPVGGLAAGHHQPMVPGQPREGRRLSRAMSFKHPERVSQIPPPEVTRLRSKSQVSVNESSSEGSSSGFGSGGNYVEMRPTPNYNYQDSPGPDHGQYIKPWQPRERFMVQRNQSFMPPKTGLAMTRAQIVRREIQNGERGPPRGKQRQPLPPEFLFSGGRPGPRGAALAAPPGPGQQWRQEFSNEDDRSGQRKDLDRDT